MLDGIEDEIRELLSDKRDAAGEVIYHGLSVAEKSEIRLHDLAIIRDPYVAIGLVVLAVFVVFLFVKIPNMQGGEMRKSSKILPSNPVGEGFPLPQQTLKYCIRKTL